MDKILNRSRLISTRLNSFIQRRANAIIGVTILATIGSLTLLPGLRFENNLGKMDIPSDDPIRAELERFKSDFGSGEMLLVGMETSRPFRSGDLGLIRNLHGELSAIQGVGSVSSLASALELAWKSSFGISVLQPYPLMEHLRETLNSPQRMHDELFSPGIYTDNLISADLKKAAFVLVVDPGLSREKDSMQSLQRLLVSIRQVLKSHEGSGIEFHVAGPVVIEEGLQKAARRDLKIFAPVCVIALFLTLLFVYRSFRPILLGSTTACLALLWSLALLPMTKTPMSIGLTMIVPLIISMAIVYAVHYLACLNDRRGRDETMMSVFDGCIIRLIVPSLLCGFTTSAGFFSLAASGLEGIREVGIFMGIGILFCVWLANFFLPALVLKTSRSGGGVPFRSSSAVERIIGRLRVIVIRHPLYLIAPILVLTAIACLGLSMLRVETNHLEYLRNDREVMKSFDFVDKNFGGILPLEIIVDIAPDRIGDAVQGIRKMESEIRALPKVGSVFSAVDVANEAMLNEPPPDVPHIPTLAGGSDLTDKRVWKLMASTPSAGNYIHYSDSMLTFRIACRMHIAGSRELRGQIAEIDRLTGKYLNSNPVHITGQARYFARVEQYVLSTQIRSLLLALLVTVILLGLMSGSRGRGLAVVLVNIIPVLLVLGMMGWLQIPLDISTVMIASIVIGVVVDDTIHLVFRYRMKLSEGYSSPSSLDAAFGEVGQPVVTSTVVLIAGFASLIPARFIPTSYFGALSAMIVLVAAIADLLLLPALLTVFASGNRRNGEPARPKVQSKITGQDLRS